MALVQRPPSLTECPRSPDSLHFAAWWYRVPSIPDFLICTKCFEDKIAHTHLASSLEPFYHTPTPGKKATCMFNGITIDRIFGNALQSSYGGMNALNTFLAHARNRVQVQDCPGTKGVRSDQGIRWYGVPQIPDFMACEACYLDFICGSSFVTNFSAYPTQQQPDQYWACDIAIPNVKKHLIEDSKRYDWAAFVNAASHRLHQPQCDGSEQSLVQRNWYTLSTVPNLLICETCYLDEIDMTANMGHFSELRAKWTVTMPQPLTGHCSFAKLAVQLCNNQLLKKDFNRWLHTIARITYLPACTGNTIQNADWHMLINPWTQQPTNLGFCTTCYIGCIESSDNSHMFRTVHIPGVGFCEFCPANPRLTDSINHLMEYLLTQNSNKFIDYAIGLHPQDLSTLHQHPASSSDWRTISAKMAQQHAFRMSAMNMIFAQNQRHNAAMQGILSGGSAYNKWHDSKFTNADWDYKQAQNQLFNAVGGRF